MVFTKHAHEVGDAAMTDELALAEIVQTLTVGHGCHAVILYGSRARGDFQPTSDWDVAGIREAGATAPLRVARALYGAWLDAFVYAEGAFTVIDPEMLRFLPARILVDERGFAKALLERIDALDQSGPPQLPEGEDEMVRVWHSKMLERIARGDLEAKYRRVELLSQALENYFKLRRLWYRGPKAGLPWLAKHDPETHTVFARALEPQASLEDLRALVQRVLPTQETRRAEPFAE
jgi:predicted nucleotidyltransferase